MNENLNLSEFGEQCVKLWEEGTLKPKLVAYDDGGGTWTISWGCIEGVYKGMRITPEEAEAMFQKEIAKHVALVRKYVKTPLTQQEFDAAVSFVFNEGVPKGWVAAINSKTYQEDVPRTLMKFVYVKGKRWPGLVVRRTDELQLWHGVYEDARLTVPCPYEVANNNDVHYADPAKKDLSHKTTATVTAAATGGVYAYFHQFLAALGMGDPSVPDGWEDQAFGLLDKASGHTSAIRTLAESGLIGYAFWGGLLYYLLGHVLPNYLEGRS